MQANEQPRVGHVRVLWPHGFTRVWPALVLRGAQSDFLTYDTMRQMQWRGLAASQGLVRAAEIPDCGHAPSLMASQHIDIVADFATA